MAIVSTYCHDRAPAESKRNRLLRQRSWMLRSKPLHPALYPPPIIRTSPVRIFARASLCKPPLSAGSVVSTGALRPTTGELNSPDRARIAFEDKLQHKALWPLRPRQANRLEGKLAWPYGSFRNAEKLQRGWLMLGQSSQDPREDIQQTCVWCRFGAASPMNAADSIFLIKSRFIISCRTSCLLSSPGNVIGRAAAQ